MKLIAGAMPLTQDTVKGAGFNEPAPDSFSKEVYEIWNRITRLSSSYRTHWTHGITS